MTLNGRTPDPEGDRIEAQERADRSAEKASIALPGREDRAPSCYGCGAPIGAPCAAYCRTEQGS